MDKYSPIAYCEGYIYIFVREYDYPTNNYSFASKIIRLPASKSHTHSVARYSHGELCRSM